MTNELQGGPNNLDIIPIPGAERVNKVTQEILPHKDSSRRSENVLDTGPALGYYKGLRIKEVVRKGGHLAGMSPPPQAETLWTAKRYNVHHTRAEAVQGVGHACTLRQRVLASTD